MANDHRNCEFRKEELTVDCVAKKESTDMAPKDDKSDKNKPESKMVENNNGAPEIAEEDLQEIASVNDNLDSLNSALDVMEQRADDIRVKLMELLNSNREIYQSMKEENENSTPNDTEQSS